jgi:hypothetical protein
MFEWNRVLIFIIGGQWVEGKYLAICTGMVMLDP